MVFARVYRLMDERPTLFLLPPVLFFTAVDIYLGVSPAFLLAFTLPTLAVTHYLLIGLKALFKREREGRNKEGIHKYSFPSYHSGLAACFCTMQSLLLPITAPLMLFLIVLTAWGRIKLDMHDAREVTFAVLVVLPIVFVFHWLASLLI